MTLTFASYNIHRCYGRDDVHEPSRVREVLRQTEADVIALQEVEVLHDQPGLLDFFCENSPWRPIQGPTMARDRADYGNAILTSLPTVSIDRLDISQAGREPRGAIDLVLQAGGIPLRVLATHLGLKPWERRAQVQQILEAIRNASGRRREAALTVLMGDLNEWFLWGRPLRYLRRQFKTMPAPATFPSHCPMFALDRIWVDPVAQLTRLRTLDNPLARIASDHLPLVAEVRIGPD